MADTERVHHGTKTLVEMPVESGTVIEKGDFVILDSGYVTQCSDKYPSGSRTAKATVQDAIADSIVGIAQTASADGETDNVIVDISLESIYEFDQDTAAAISFGDLLEIACASVGASSYYPYDQKVSAGTTNPIAVCVKEHTDSTTKTLLKLIPQDNLNDTGTQGN